VVDLLKNFEPEIESITLIPSDGGRFGVDLVRTYLKEGK